MKTTLQFHLRLMALAGRSVTLALALASASLASAQTNDTHFGASAGGFVGTGDDNSAYGFSALQLNNSGSRNTAIGSLTLQGNISGVNNTAVGFGALTVSIASGNTALGSQALQNNTSGANNTGTGVSALVNTTIGSFNTANGRSALGANIDGTNNSAFGYQALFRNTSGDFNVAVGDGALQNNTTGNGNIGIGEDGGFNLTVGDNNISIGNKGVAGESGIIRIGTSPTHTHTHLTGVIHGDGSGLSNLNAAGLVGTVADLRLSSNVALRGGGNKFFGNQSVIGNGLASSIDLNPFDTGANPPATRIQGTDDGNFSGHLDFMTKTSGNGGTNPLVNRMRITSQGNVGIGTPTPRQKLHVVGNAVFTGGPAGGADPGDSAGPATRIGYDATNGYGFITANDTGVDTRNLILQTNGGNVGIGTFTPTANLQVRSKPVSSGAFTAETSAAALLKSATTNGGNTPAPSEPVLVLGRDGIIGESFANYARFDLSRWEDNASESRTQLDIRLSHGRLDAFGSAEMNNTPTILSLRSNGNVGIGTTTPAAKLDILAGANLFGSGPVAIALQYDGGGFRHFIRSRHNSVVNDPGNAIDFFLNSSTTAGGSSAPGVGNVKVMTINGAGNVDVAGEITGTALNITSDRNAKEQFKPVNVREVLDKVSRLPISEWQYKTQADARHIGPMAQDFREAFALGRDEKHITSVDADGVALAAIQGLNEKLEEQVRDKDRRIEELAKAVEELKDLVNKLSPAQNGGAK